MIARITTVLTRLRTEWATPRQPDAILAACPEAGDPAWRARVLTPVTPLQLCLLQMLHGHTACRHRPHRSGIRFSAPAYGQARARLPRRCVALRWERFNRAGPRSAVGGGRWPGQRLCCVDGSTCARPESASPPGRVRAIDGAAAGGRRACGAPVGAVPGRHRGAPAARRRPPAAPRLGSGAGGAADPPLRGRARGLGLYAHVALRAAAGVHAVRRVGARPSVDFTPGRPWVTPRVRRPPAVTGLPRPRWRTALGVQDQLGAWWKPTTCPARLTREPLLARPASLVLREGRYGTGRPGVRTRQLTLGTTRLDGAV